VFIPVRTLDELQTRALELLKSTVLGDSGPGSVVRLLLAVVNSAVEDLYRQLSTAHYSSFVSTASGEFLDLLGDIVHCKRLPDEPDDEYRYRISQQALADATANTTAIRLAALSVEGVKDVIIHEHALGTGSCAVYVVADDPAQFDSIVESVRWAVEEVKACGTRVEVLLPRLIPIGLELFVAFSGDVMDDDKAAYRSAAELSAAKYLNSLYPGAPLVISDLLAVVKDAVHPAAEEVRILSLTRNGRKVDVADQQCRWNERFVEDGAVGVRVVSAAR
jgi:hypothetical protein